MKNGNGRRAEVDDRWPTSYHNHEYIQIILISFDDVFSRLIILHPMKHVQTTRYTLVSKKLPIRQGSDCNSSRCKQV